MVAAAEPGPWLDPAVLAFHYSTDRQAAFCKETVPAHINIPAHSAPLGLAFFPKE